MAKIKKNSVLEIKKVTSGRPDKESDAEDAT